MAKIGTSGLVDTYQITYTSGEPTTFTVTNGINGQDGVSPAVTISTITGGHSVTITDKDHPSGQSFNVLDGQDGASGAMVVETVTGTTPTITGADNHRYVCGEVSTLAIILPTSGCIDVMFNSGTTAAVLTVTPPTGWAMKWPDGFNSASLAANTTYEFNILMKSDTNECIGVVAAWT